MITWLLRCHVTAECGWISRKSALGHRVQFTFHLCTCASLGVRWLAAELTVTKCLANGESLYRWCRMVILVCKFISSSQDKRCKWKYMIKKNKCKLRKSLFKESRIVSIFFFKSLSKNSNSIIDVYKLLHLYLWWQLVNMYKWFAFMCFII